MVSRRRFLTTGGVVALAAGVAPASVLDRLPFGRRFVSSGELTRATFEGLELSEFTLRPGLWKKERLQLMSVCEEHAPSMPGSRTEIEQFSLIFRGSGAGSLEQATYRLEHDRVGEFDLFIVPIGGRERGQQHYQAVFNRILA